MRMIIGPTRAMSNTKAQIGTRSTSPRQELPNLRVARARREPAIQQRIELTTTVPINVGSAYEMEFMDHVIVTVMIPAV
jgi:hypothetical protein